MNTTKPLLDTFTLAYVTCALWSSTDYNGNAFDGCDADSLAPSALQTMIDDCKDFQRTNEGLLSKAQELDASYTIDRAGHDFWLTRNRHGAGFWDRGLGIVGKDLTEMAHPYGSCGIYKGDDGLLYVA